MDGRSQSQEELPAAARFSYPDAPELAHTGSVIRLRRGGQVRPSPSGQWAQGLGPDPPQSILFGPLWVYHGCMKKEAYIWLSKISQSSKETKICR